MLPNPSVNSIQKFKLQNSLGTEVEILNLGAILHSWKIRLEGGTERDIIIGPDQTSDYLKVFESVPYYFGATVGRYAGRIREGFQLNGEYFPLESNEQGVHLHGGPAGIDRKLWDLDEEASDLPHSVVLYTRSEAGEGGYPGALDIEARYCLQDDDSLELEYRAVSNTDTVLNLTNHVYFNLDGNPLTQQSLQLASARCLETNPYLLPTGRFTPLEDDVKDFRKQKNLEALPSYNGLDHCFLLDQISAGEPAIRYQSAKGDLTLEGWSNQAAVVVFAPKHLEVDIDLKEQQVPFPSICFEFQNLPDAPNFPQFPSAELKAGEVYRHQSKFQLLRR